MNIQELIAINATLIAKCEIQEKEITKLKEENGFLQHDVEHVQTELQVENENLLFTVNKLRSESNDLQYIILSLRSKLTPEKVQCNTISTSSTDTYNSVTVSSQQPVIHVSTTTDTWNSDWDDKAGSEVTKYKSVNNPYQRELF